MFRNLIERIRRVAADPLPRIISLRYRILQKFGHREYVAATGGRSRSEAGLYVAFVRKAVRDHRAFANFKRHPSYRAVLEHVNEEEGSRYIDRLRTVAPDLLARAEEFRINDTVGNPITYSYAGIGRISPTTLRYMNVAADLRRLFGDDLGGNVAEIGVGYGGQALVLDRIFKFRQYEFFDLPPVGELASRFLESFVLNCAYKVSTLNKSTGEQEYDLVMSNYAFSEFPKVVQLAYIKKIMLRAKRGYLTMNTGRTPKENKVSLDDLRQIIPNLEVFEELPPIAPTNYVIVWGHNRPA